MEERTGGSRTVNASEFSKKCFQLMAEVAEDGGEVIITRYGKPVARLLPCDEEPAALFGRNRESIRILGDIVSPMPREWYEDLGDEALT